MPDTGEPAPDVSFSDVRRIIAARCVTCHSSQPTHPTAPVPAAGVVFDTEHDIAAWATRIYERTVVNQTMPLANLTEITNQERTVIAQWYRGGAKTE